MAHLHRFHVPPDVAGAGEVFLPSEEAHHALHVVRVRDGDLVALFDGQGRELRGRITRTTRHEVFVTVDAERTAPPPPVRLVLLQAGLNRDKSAESLVRRGAEIGIGHFRFFRGEHTAKPPRLHEKWRRIAIEACKQCGRLWLPTFDIAPDLAGALEDAPGTRLVATKEAASIPLREAVAHAPTEVALVVGPEGGLAPEEVRLACDAGAAAVSLGEMTYRSEVAAPLAAALILYELGQLGPR